MVLTQTHPAAPYVCRTGNINLRCISSGRISWRVGDMFNVDPSNTPGHTLLPPTSTYQEVVVDSYTNLGHTHQCTANDAILSSNTFIPVVEGKCLTIYC